MPAHYPTFRDQIKEDLVDVLGATTIVCFGRPRREITTYPHAIVKTSVRREFEGPRRVREQYEFEIVCHLALPDPYPEDGGEAYAMEQAEFVVDRLAPHSTTSVPSYSPYAGIGNPNEVRLVEYIETEDTDSFLSFRLLFLVEATVAA